MEQVEPEDIAIEDPSYWAELNKIKLQKGVWSFKERPYLIEPMRQSYLYRIGQAPRRQCDMKATQGGFSEAHINESLHGMINGHYPGGVLYLFPTTEDMREFSKSRFGPLISANSSAIGRFVQDTDTANLKRVNGASLFMRGARLSQHLEVDAQESAKLRSITVDVVKCDEYDLMDKGVREKALGRLRDSKVKFEVYVSNPTLPEKGISQVFETSDQRHWFRQCRCGRKAPEGADWEWYMEKVNGWICAEIQFPDNVECDDVGVGYIACRNCGKPVPVTSPGLWVPREPSKSKYMWGYHWSQLTSATNDPYEILQEFSNPPEDNLGDVVRLRLGKPFVSAEDKLTEAQVLSCCGYGPQLNGHAGPCAMGLDIRKHKNVVIGCRVGRDRYRILRVARLDSMEDVMQMAYRFNVRICIGDIRPYEDEMRRFQKEAKFKVWLCQYSESTPQGTKWNDKEGLVIVNRTESLDASHRLIGESRVELPTVCPEIQQFAKECAAIAKVQEINKRTNGVIFRYRKLSDTVPDDYRHALNYFNIAASGHHLSVVGNPFTRQRPRYAKNDYVRC